MCMLYMNIRMLIYKHTHSIMCVKEGGRGREEGGGGGGERSYRWLISTSKN